MKQIDSQRAVETEHPVTGDPAARSVEWTLTEEDVTPYRALVDGHEWLVRVNDFPDEHLYTLLADGRAIKHLDDWPLPWLRPTRAGSAPDEARRLLRGVTFVKGSIRVSERAKLMIRDAILRRGVDQRKARSKSADRTRTVAISDKLHDKLRIRSFKTGRTVRELAESYVRAGLEADNPRPRLRAKKS